jgi:hypothetical protein
VKTKINLSQDNKAKLFSEQKLAKLQKLVDLQAEDEALWLCDLDDAPPLSALEGYLQQALRKLHTAVEANSIAEIEAIIEGCKE